MKIIYHFKNWWEVARLVKKEKRALRVECIDDHQKNYGKTPIIGNSAFVRVYISPSVQGFNPFRDLSFINDYHDGADNLTLTQFKRIVEKMRLQLIHEGMTEGHFDISLEGGLGVADSIQEAHESGYHDDGNVWEVNNIATIKI